MSVRTLLLFVLVVALGATPAIAMAAAPPTTPQTIVNVGVESGDTRSFSLVPTPGVSKYYWGPISNVKHGGTQSLWVAGKVYPGGAVSNKFPTYPADTVGSAYLYLTELDQYYSSTLSYWYLCPSRGGADGESFKFSTLNNPSETLIKLYTLNNVASWTRMNYDLSLSVNGQVSRKDISAQFRFADSAEGGGIPIGNGQGPAIDDFVVTAYKYGPVRALEVGQLGQNVRLAWLRPYRSLAETIVEERTIAYRVWRSVAGANSWTELTGGGRLADGTLSFNDPITSEGVAYEYYVQAWDPGTGTGYGRAVKSGFVGAPAANPIVTITSPASPFALDEGSVTVAGTASDSGSGVSDVSIRIRRADGRSWTGSAWSATETWLAPGAHATDWSTWSASWTPDADVQSSGQVVTVSARATDASGRTSIVSAYSEGLTAPVDLTIARSAAVIPYAGTARITGKLTSMDNPVVGKSVVLQYYSDGWKPLATKSTAGDGSVYFDVTPRNKTAYRLSFAASGFQSKVTSPLEITPKVYLTKPSKPSSARKNRTFTSSGYIKPKHTSGSYPVKVKAYRYQGGEWVLRKTFSAKVSTVSSTTSKYVAKVKLPYTGKWRLRAVAPTDSKHYETWSSRTKSFSVR